MLFGIMIYFCFRLQLYINNEWVKAKSGETFPSIDPATGRVLAHIQSGGKGDVNIAVKAARDAFK